MKSQALLYLCTSFIFSGCTLMDTLNPSNTTPTPAKNVQLTQPFNEQETKNRLSSGSSSLMGSALIPANKNKFKQVLSCANKPVALIPATLYAQERIKVVYGSAQGGISYKGQQDYTFTPDPDAFRTTVKRTTCSATGNFAFEKLKPGAYYIATSLSDASNSPDKTAKFTQLYLVK
jgi:hypothetical protein